MLHKNFSFMILINDPAGKTKAQAPSSFLGGKARLKNFPDIFRGYAFA
jgi:hypothetical protein